MRQWYEPIKDPNVTIAPDVTSAAVRSYLAGATEARVPGRTHAFHYHPDKDEVFFPLRSTLTRRRSFEFLVELWSAFPSS